MKFRKLLIVCASIMLVIASCKKDNKLPGGGSTGKGDTTVTTKPTPYTITETFESGKKPGYAAADVTLSTGSWNFNDALIGNLAGDVKDGNWAVRLRTGDIAMNFDINGLTQISIKHAKYGSDASSVWQLKMSTDGGATYTQVGADINETNTTLVTDSFKVSTTAKVRFEIVKTGTTRINIDDITFKGTGDPGLTVGPPDTTGGVDTTGTGTSSKTRGVTVGPDAPPASGDNSDLLFGNPSGAVNSVAMMDNYLIDQGYYTESYNSTKAEPNWVSWHLDASNITNVSDRLNNFAGFSGLPSGWYTVQSNSYNYSTYGFDRGHNCPSADRTSSVNANSATFLMTNMIPQAPQNNQQTWGNLENYLREQVVAGNEVYIIMGSYGTGGTGVNGPFSSITAPDNGHVNVPSNVWKVAVIIPVGDGDVNRVTASTRVIAVNTPNINSINSDWKQYIVTVKDIETATGYSLLTALSPTVRASLEVKKDSGN
ncbi:DNA/RNA non-specific endonuclease [Mucilaginibacter phenanthrenivorans]|uniref:DNA/RNA non-specific endonuclease n=1 Tax=Mucilaginibacter phenanthrenivorans TaxID=1234842 RepID=UPI0021580453|nr:DNA/RNA non-specific endonuclease [Mucilaginibacter phenanthrenivorans]